MKRPLLLVLLPYVGGVLFADMVSPSLVLPLGCALAAVAAAIAWDRGRPWLLYVVCFLVGWANASFHTAAISPNDLRALLGQEPHLALVRGVVEETPTIRVYEQGEQQSWRTLARLRVTALCLDKQNWQPAHGQIAVTTPAPLTNVFAGQDVEVSGVAALPRLAVAEGTFDYRAYLKQQGIYYHLQADTAEDWQILRSPASPPLADRFRTWARQVLARGLPGEDESLRLEWALTLGWKPALTEEVSEPFVRAATYHIFAVDGLRMAIIFGIFFGLFRALGIPRSVSGLVLLPLIWFYVALTGWPASAIRATVMLSLVIGGWILKRPTDLLNSLFAAALLILLWQPQQLFQAGFQLSFLVVLCLILMLPPLWLVIRRWTAPEPLLPPSLRRRWPAFILVPARYCGDVLLTSFAAWIGSIPLVAYYFHIVTPVSTPANLLAVPLCGLVLVSNLASLLLAGWFAGAAELFNHAGWFLMECIRVSSCWFAAWPAAYRYVVAPSFLTSFLYYAVLLAVATGWLFQATGRYWKCAALAVALAFWGWNNCWREATTTRLTVLPVNGGIAAYYDAPGRHNDLLCDTGPTNSVQFTTKPFLRGQGVNRLKGLLLTHGDVHHVGGAFDLVDLFHPAQVAIGPLRFRSSVYRKLVSQLQQNPQLVRSVERGARVGQWEVLHPQTGDKFTRADDGALVLRADIAGFRVLLLSDLGRAGQEALFERTEQLRADIVVAGLPSTGEPVCESLLNRLQPRLLVVADSPFPASERAGARLQARLAERHIPVIYTRLAGAATFEFRGRSCCVKTMSGESFQLIAGTRASALEPKSGAPAQTYPLSEGGRSENFSPQQSPMGVTLEWCCGLKLKSALRPRSGYAQNLLPIENRHDKL
ncbi:MAG TPA: ComEC/Rec2 family competence protein [Verrucomicrobiae bacterium]|nr:ComEC/Rec2 family competence protein [Verrucomicrobiae bacterium]